MAAPFNLADINHAEDTAIDNDFLLSVIDAYIGNLPEKKSGKFVLSGKYLEASPFALVTNDDAPTLIYYSDNDPVIAPRQATEMYKKLVENKIPSKIIALHNQGHNPVPI